MFKPTDTYAKTTCNATPIRQQEKIVKLLQAKKRIVDTLQIF